MSFQPYQMVFILNGHHTGSIGIVYAKTAVGCFNVLFPWGTVWTSNMRGTPTTVISSCDALILYPSKY